MPTHMVMFRSAEGKPGFHQTDGLDEAIRFVEHLRNVENVPDARVYKLTEVPLEVRTIYKIEVADEPVSREPVAAAAASSTPAAPPEASSPTAAVREAVSGATPVSPPPAPPVGAVVDEGDRSLGSPIANGGSTARFGRFNRG